MAAPTLISRKPLSFVLSLMAILGALAGLLVGMGLDSALIGLIFGAVFSVGLSFFAISMLSNEKMARWGLFAFWLVTGVFFFELAGGLVGALWGWFFGWFVFWLFFSLFGCHFQTTKQLCKRTRKTELFFSCVLGRFKNTKNVQNTPTTCKTL